QNHVEALSTVLRPQEIAHSGLVIAVGESRLVQVLGLVVDGGSLAEQPRDVPIDQNRDLRITPGRVKHEHTLLPTGRWGSVDNGETRECEGRGKRPPDGHRPLINLRGAP